MPGRGADLNQGGGRRRVIFHADMDAFYAAVEQRDRPEWRGRPVIVGGTGRRGVVSTASYEARRFGVHSAMPMAEARRRCPAGVVVPPDFARYEEASRRIREVFDRFSPRVEPLSLDEAFLDMTGTERLFGPPEATARRLMAEVRAATDGLTVSVGVAGTKFVAKLASDLQKPDGLTVVPDDRVLDVLHPLPVERLWGVGPHTAATLQALGLHTIGDLAHRDPADLQRRLGTAGPHLHALAWGRDDREVVAEHDAQSVGAEETLEEDLRGAAAIRPVLRRSAERVARRLRAEGLTAGGVRVKLKTSAFRLSTRQAALEPPADTAAALLAAAEPLLAEFDLAVPMRLVGLAAFRLAAADGPGQQPLFPDEDRERRRRLERALDAVRGRFGDEAVRRGAEVPDGSDSPGEKPGGGGRADSH